MKIQNTLQKSVNNSDPLFRPQLVDVKMIKLIKDLFNFSLSSKYREESKRYREEAKRNIAETQRLLTLDGEEQWMLNICRKTKDSKECYPDDNNK